MASPAVSVIPRRAAAYPFALRRVLYSWTLFGLLGEGCWEEGEDSEEEDDEEEEEEEGDAVVDEVNGRGFSVCARCK